MHADSEGKTGSSGQTLSANSSRAWHKMFALQGWQDAPVDKAVCHASLSHLQNPHQHGRRELTPQS